MCLAALLDTMKLDSTHKLQVAGESKGSGIVPPDAVEADLVRIDERHRLLPESVQRRVVVESPGSDSLGLWSLTGIPIVYRTGSPSAESLDAALSRYRQTWADDDGAPVVDLRRPDTSSIHYLLATAPDADCMLEADTLPPILARSDAS
jgi:hypothetical protein